MADKEFYSPTPKAADGVEALQGNKSLFDDEEEHLKGLEETFLRGLDARSKSDVDKATELFREVLRGEPRLAEPRLELATLLIEGGQLDEALEQAREAVRILDSGGQWTMDVPGNVLRSLAWETLGEALRRTADQDTVVFGDPDVWRGYMAEAKVAFKNAATLDPDNAYASQAAFGFNPDSSREPEPEDIEQADLVEMLAEMEKVGNPT